MYEPKVRYFTGVDLGQAQDYTALAVLERRKVIVPGAGQRRVSHYAVRYLERFPLGTSYTSICNRLLRLFQQEPLTGSIMGVDQTGVGRPVLDMLRRSGIRAAIQAVTITGGYKASEDSYGGFLVPKRELVTTLQVVLQSHRIQIASTLPEAKVLNRELLNFQVKISSAANETFGVWREGAHDDLVLAVALAAWRGEHTHDLNIWCGG
jgi:hypothetical protein